MSGSTTKSATSAAQRRLLRLARQAASSVDVGIGSPAGAGAAAGAGAGIGAGAGSGCVHHSATACFADPLGDVELKDEYDYIIVGGGSAGAVVASRLSEDPSVDVLLLEAGDSNDSHLKMRCATMFMDLQLTEQDWQDETPPQAHLNDRVIRLPRGKVLGGCSAINCTVYVRGNKENFNGWEREGCEGWGYKDVLPYFKKAEKNMMPSLAGSEYHGRDGPVSVVSTRELNCINPTTEAFIAGCPSAGIPLNDDYNGETQEGAGPTQFTNHEGKRCSTSNAYLRGSFNRQFAAMNRPNLTVACLCHVMRVVTAAKRAVGVTFKRGSINRDELRGKPTQFVGCRREVIVSAGAHNTPVVLMHSGIGPAKHLASLGIPQVADLPVGLNLSDHVMVFLTYACKTDDALPSFKFHPKMLANIFRYLCFGSGVLQSNLLQGTAFYHSELPKHTLDSAPDAPDTQIHFIPTTGNENAWEKTGLINGGSHLRPGAEPRRGVLFIPILVRPVSRGYVRLRSADPLDKPEIQTNYLAEQRDMDVLVEGVRRCRRIARSPQFAKFAGDELLDSTIPHDPESKEYIEEFVRRSSNTVYHPCGVCRMGPPSAATTVVDPRCRVVGIRGLRVADASVIPHVISGNTNAPCIMVGEKVADMIKEDWA